MKKVLFTIALLGLSTVGGHAATITKAGDEKLVDFSGRAASLILELLRPYGRVGGDGGDGGSVSVEWKEFSCRQGGGTTECRIRMPRKRLALVETLRRKQLEQITISGEPVHTLLDALKAYKRTKKEVESASSSHLARDQYSLGKYLVCLEGSFTVCELSTDL
jgi:hypothetical protein